MDDTLPPIKKKKKINVQAFVKRAKKLKKDFEEEVEYRRRKNLEYENLLSGKFL